MHKEDSNTILTLNVSQYRPVQNLLILKYKYLLSSNSGGIYKGTEKYKEYLNIFFLKKRTKNNVMCQGRNYY